MHALIERRGYPEHARRVAQIEAETFPVSERELGIDDTRRVLEWVACPDGTTTAHVFDETTDPPTFVAPPEPPTHAERIAERVAEFAAAAHAAIDSIVLESVVARAAFRVVREAVATGENPIPAGADPAAVARARSHALVDAWVADGTLAAELAPEGGI